MWMCGRKHIWSQGIATVSCTIPKPISGKHSSITRIGPDCMRRTFCLGKFRPTRLRNACTVLAVFACIGAISVAAVSGMAAEAPMTRLANANHEEIAGIFRSQLMAPPWLRYVKLVTSQRFNVHSHTNGPRTVAFLYDGCFYSNSLYLRALSNSASSKYDVIFGETDRFYWKLEVESDVVSVAPKRREEGQSRNNNVEILVTQMARPLLDAVRRLGVTKDIVALTKWTSPSTFIGLDPCGREIEGTVSFSKTGLPLMLVCVRRDRNEVVGRIVYEYATNRAFPPRTIIVSNCVQRVATTNVLLDYVPDSASAKLLLPKPSDFRDTNRPLSAFILNSNAVVYRILRNGTWLPVDVGKSVSISPASAPLGAATTLVLYALVVWLTWFAVLLAVRQARQFLTR